MRVETCGGVREIPFGSLRVDFEGLAMRRDGEKRWRAILPVKSGGLTALLGYGPTPKAALDSLCATCQQHGVKMQYGEPWRE